MDGDHRAGQPQAGTKVAGAESKAIRLLTPFFSFRLTHLVPIDGVRWPAGEPEQVFHRTPAGPYLLLRRVQFVKPGATGNLVFKSADLPQERQMPVEGAKHRPAQVPESGRLHA
jgi:hypothetical protein